MSEGETAQKPHSVLPRLLDVIEDRLPGSPGFGEDSNPEEAQNPPAPPSPEPEAPSAEHLLFKADSKTRLPPPPRHSDPTLDFFSIQFDPLKALQHDLKRPNELVAPLNSLPQCRFILPAEMKESLVHLQQLSTKTKEDIERERARSGPARVRRQAEEWKQSAVEKIAQHKKLYVEKAQMRFAGLLKAFDKHMNLILQDVEEHYTVRLRIQKIKQIQYTDLIDAPARSQGGQEKVLAVRTAEKSRTAYKQDHRTRRLRQVFVRGSNVVMVSAAPA